MEKEINPKYRCVQCKKYKMTNQVYYQQGGGDEQYTPKYGVEVLLPHIQHLKDKIIWCPFDREDSQFVKVLKENGFKVVYSHIDYGQDLNLIIQDLQQIAKVSEWLIHR